ncbi:MAG: hypothetical protein Q7L55_08470 [Actinomycetota bacterium]|nr:hypothetical protein [Actinomycetota bacterium]
MPGANGCRPLGCTTHAQRHVTRDVGDRDVGLGCDETLWSNADGRTKEGTNTRSHIRQREIAEADLLLELPRCVADGFSTGV